MRSGIVLAIVALAAIGFAGLSIGKSSAAEVSIAGGNNYFCDSSYIGQVCETNVTAGDTVTWTMEAGVHTVTLCTDGSFGTCTGGFDSGLLEPNDTYTRTFDTPGTYFYYCALHPSQMRGKLVVAAPTPTPSPAPATSGPATVTATPAPALPNTGGAPGDGDAGAWLYTLMALGAVLLAASGLSFALARQR